MGWMKRGSARLIIVVLALAVILLLSSRAYGDLSTCGVTGLFGTKPCEEAWTPYLMQIGVVALVAIAAWVWTRALA